MEKVAQKNPAVANNGNPQKRIWLKLLRVERDMSQMDVAKALNMPQVSYSQIELGRMNPSIKYAKKIGNYFGFDWTRFFD